jgi:hemoglobin-like flavoprotein
MTGEINQVDSDARKDLLDEQFSKLEEAAPEPVDAAPEPEQKADRVRDESGKFAKVEQTQPEVQPEEEPVWKRPPASWKKEFHDAWKTADPRLQEYAFQREEQMRRGVEPLLTKAQFADQMQEAISPFMNTIRGLGVAPHQAVRKLMEADHVLRTSSPDQKLQLLTNLARDYGVDLTGANPVPMDQTYQQLMNELRNVKGEVMTWKEQQEHAQNQGLLNEINGFASKAEYFEEARPRMIELLNSGVAKSLQDAYDQAIWGNPEIRDQMLKAQQANLSQHRIIEANRAAKAARSAAVSVRSSTPGTNTAPKAQDRRSLLEAAFNEAANDKF